MSLPEDGDGDQPRPPLAQDRRPALRGVTQPVTFELVARRNGATIEANGSIPIAFDDFQIPDASAGPATVGRDGELELLLVFTR